MLFGAQVRQQAAMEGSSVPYSFFLIFSGAAVLASFALYTRQPLLVAYIAIGALFGPSGLHLTTDTAILKEIAKIGIIFLLFLLGLDMQPKNLLHTLREATFVGLVSSLLFAGFGFGVGWMFGFTTVESLIIGVAMMFSSTIIGIKLLPTTVLHHRHTGEIVVGLLLLQDLIAILVLLLLHSGDSEGFAVHKLAIAALSLPVLIVASYLFVRYVLVDLFRRFDRFHEYVFLLAIGWCLGIAELAHAANLSHEIGAFIAGVALATSPISQYIATSLKPLRDFFLILFFFSLGAGLDLALVMDVLVPSILLAGLVLVIKPVVFWGLLRQAAESRRLAWEVGFRLGQNSEFSLLIAFIATGTALISNEASHLIQATAIISFLVSSYIVVFNFPSPIAVSDKLRRD